MAKLFQYFRGGNPPIFDEVPSVDVLLPIEVPKLRRRGLSIALLSTLSAISAVEVEAGVDITPIGEVSSPARKFIGRVPAGIDGLAPIEDSADTIVGSVSSPTSRKHRPPYTVDSSYAARHIDIAAVDTSFLTSLEVPRQRAKPVQITLGDFTAAIHITAVDASLEFPYLGSVSKPHRVRVRRQPQDLLGPIEVAQVVDVLMGHLSTPRKLPKKFAQYLQASPIDTDDVLLGYLATPEKPTRRVPGAPQAYVIDIDDILLGYLSVPAEKRRRAAHDLQVPFFETAVPSVTHHDGAVSQPLPRRRPVTLEIGTFVDESISTAPALVGYKEFQTGGRGTVFKTSGGRVVFHTDKLQKLRE